MLVVPLHIFSMQVVKNINKPAVIFVYAFQTAINGRVRQLYDMKFRNTVNVSFFLFFFMVDFHLYLA